jgi:hypothetical protein
MTKRATTIALAALLALGLLAGPAAAARPDTDCLRAGQRVLRELGAFQLAAKGQLDYAPLDATGLGLIRTELGDEAFLPLATVFQLHLNRPELFAWCD